MKTTLFLFIAVTQFFFAQNRINPSLLKTDFALENSRIKYKAELNEKIEKVFSGKLNSENEKEWRILFKEIGLMLIRNDKVYSAIKKAVKYAPSGSIQFQRSVVETIITLYPERFPNTIDYFFNTTNDPILFGYCANLYLKKSIISKDSLATVTKNRFPSFEKIPQIKFLLYNLERDSIRTPPLKELLTASFMEDKTIIFSFHREERKYPGITIIRKPNGEFVKSGNDSIFYVKQLALSVTDLPGYLSQGNTPQGIFSIVGFYNSPTPSIGPTAAVLTRIPYEVPTKLWFHEKYSGKWNKKEYEKLLPPSWKNYLPIYEAYYAGLTGRRKIVMHGSVDDLSFYDTLAYAPLTPSKGCLTTTEIWDEVTGKNIISDQAKLMNAFFSTGELKGFLIVVNIDNKKYPVTIKEIEEIINR